LGLVHAFTVSDETLDAVCDSLKTHPTLEVLNLQPYEALPQLTPGVLKSHIQALLDMLKGNMLIHTILLPDQYSQHELDRKSVIPYLETNRFRPRVLAIQKARPITYRAKVLGGALLSACTDANSFWMLLSGNAEVVFSSTTATTTPTTNLPTPASTNAATPANVAPIVAAAAVTATARHAASTAGASTAVNITSPSAYKKRKAPRP
jgi:hypothetical protein